MGDLQRYLLRHQTQKLHCTLPSSIYPARSPAAAAHNPLAGIRAYQTAYAETITTRNCRPWFSLPSPQQQQQQPDVAVERTPVLLALSRKRGRGKRSLYTSSSETNFQIDETIKPGENNRLVRLSL